MWQIQPASWHLIYTTYHNGHCSKHSSLCRVEFVSIHAAIFSSFAPSSSPSCDNQVMFTWSRATKLGVVPLRMRPGCDTQQFTVTASSLSSLWRSNFLTEKDDIWRTKLSEYAFIREVSQIYTLDKEHPCTNVLRGEIKNFVSVTYFLVYHVCSALCDCHRVAWQWPIDLVYGKSLWNDAGIDLIYLAKRVSDETWKNTP